MLDKTYIILKKINSQPIFKSELAELCKDSYVTPSLMLKKQWIDYSGLSEDGEPLEPFKITDKGLEYLLLKTQKDEEFWRDFFSNFISGFIVGILVAIAGAYFLYKLGLK